MNLVEVITITRLSIPHFYTQLSTTPHFPLSTPLCSADYFTSVLFKNLMGRHVLHVTKQSAEPAASFHVWCAAPAAAPLGSVTVAFINPTGKREGASPRCYCSNLT